MIENRNTAYIYVQYRFSFIPTIEVNIIFIIYNINYTPYNF